MPRYDVHMNLALKLTAEDLDEMARQSPCVEEARVTVYDCPWQPQAVLYVVQIGDVVAQAQELEYRWQARLPRADTAAGIVDELRRRISLAAWRPTPADLSGDLMACAARMAFAADAARRVQRDHETTTALLTEKRLTLIEEM